MARYDAVVQTINAHLINEANVADTETWPEWITAITSAGNGNWIVETTENGFFEIQEGKYISIAGSGITPVQLEPAVIENDYVPYVAE